MKNKSYQIGQLLFILALGLMLFKDKFDVGIIYNRAYSVLAVIGVILMAKGFYESNKSNN